MALGDGIRRNVATVDPAERALLRDAIIELHRRHYPGSRSDSPVGGVSFWFKQDEIHQATHVHHGPAFIPWHRELVNRFEALLREVDPRLSLHYWDWTTDPRGLFTPDFMGSANGDAGEPWLSAGFYNPTANPFRADDNFDPNNNPFDPPRTLTRSLSAGAPAVPPDSQILAATTFPQMRLLLEDAHDSVHTYIGGTIGDPHTAFRDPFVFLLHSNVDRLFAMWQTAPGQAWRLDPAQVYGTEGNSGGPQGIRTPLEPWANVASPKPTRPWAPPENRAVVKDSRHPSVVAPPCYDTLPTVPATLVQETTALTFNDVPVGEKTVRAATFTVHACGEVHLQITNGPTRTNGAATITFDVPPLPGPAITVPHRAGYTVPKGRIWIRCAVGAGTPAGASAQGEVTIHCVETNQDFVIPITVSTIARPRAVVELVLDRSNSMSFDGGDGRTRLQVLHDSAAPFLDVLQENNAVGMVAFDHDPHDVFPVTTVGAPGDPTDTGRGDARLALQNHTHNPQGNTAIGDGVERANDRLTPVTGFDVKAMIVLTDGQETASKRINEVLSIINPNHHIFAIGLGTPEEIQPAALAALAQGHRGTLQMTGMLDRDDLFLLTKFYLQILANVTNEDIVRDPEGSLLPGQVHRVPFDLNEADIGSDVIVLSPAPQALQFALETPRGQIIDPAIAASAGIPLVVSNQVTYYRMTLPVLAEGVESHEGTWHALLSVGEDHFRRHLSRLDNQPELLASTRAHGIRYSLNVHAYSNLRFRPHLVQNSYEPGATLTLRAVLTEYGLPVERRAWVEADLVRPDATTATLTLQEVEPGIFETSVVTSQPGIYRFRLRAEGITMRGLPFTREQLLTGTVWRGGDNPVPVPTTDPRGGDDRLCRLLECLLRDDSLREFFARREIDPDVLLRCVRKFCD